MDANELIIYQPNSTLKLDVRVERDTVWLNRHQIAELFDRDIKTIGKHINNALSEELLDFPVVAKFATTAADGKTYQVEHYNLEMITSVGYRVKSTRGIQFRVWANKVLKEYLLRGYSINQHLMQVEERLDKRLDNHEFHLRQLDEKVDFILNSSITPRQGIFFDGQIFDAYALVADLIRKATRRIAVIDNYMDDTVLVQLSKRHPNVTVEIYTPRLTRQIQQDVERHNAQYPGITLYQYTKAHDRFLIIDNEVYLIGASLKDLGKKLFGFSHMEATNADELLARVRAN